MYSSYVLGFVQKCLGAESSFGADFASDCRRKDQRKVTSKGDVKAFPESVLPARRVILSANKTNSLSN
jgi:hypothetical protein